MSLNKRIVLAGCLALAVILAACATPEVIPAPADTPVPTQPAVETAYPAEPYPAYPQPAGPTVYPPAGQDLPGAYPAYPGATLDPLATAPAYPQPPSPGMPALDPYAPRPQDASWQRGEAFIEESGILTRETFPPQFVLTMSGSLPTPCNQLRIEVAEPDAQNRIMVEAYSVVDPNMMCTQVLQPFEAQVTLTDLPAGTYTVVLNGQEVGEITAP